MRDVIADVADLGSSSRSVRGTAADRILAHKARLLAVDPETALKARCPRMRGGTPIMGIRVFALCASTVLVASEARAAACNGGNCPAANLIVTGIVSPQSAGTVSSVTVEVRTSAGARANGYTGRVHL